MSSRKVGGRRIKAKKSSRHVKEDAADEDVDEFVEINIEDASPAEEGSENSSDKRADECKKKHKQVQSPWAGMIPKRQITNGQKVNQINRSMHQIQQPACKVGRRNGC